MDRTEPGIQIADWKVSSFVCILIMNEQNLRRNLQKKKNAFRHINWGV